MSIALCPETRATPDEYPFETLQDGRRRASVYVEMRDGVKIAVTIWLPPEPSARAPAVVHFTRYWREKTYNGPGPTLVHPGDERKPLADWGYAYVAVDSRGTGASFGTRMLELPQAEVEDSREIIDWIARQPWSNGRVATMGISYVGNTALMAATLPSPALKAVVARAIDVDMYEDLIFPGGLPNAMFLNQWGQYVRSLDQGDASVFGPLKSGVRITGVGPVDADPDGELRAAAIAEHSGNFYVPEYVSMARHAPLTKDDFFRESTEADRPSIARRFDRLAQAAIPTFIWASWTDAGTASGALRWFTECDCPGEVIIGAWSHGAGQNGNPYEEPYQDPNPPHPEQLRLFREFLDRHLWDDVRAQPPRRVTYFTMNEDRWRQSPVWPLAENKAHTLNLSSNGELGTSLPAPGRNHYDIDFDAGCGVETRWTTQLGGPVAYRDRQEITRPLLRFMTAPLDGDMHIVGAPLLSLLLTTDREDIALIAYLDDIAPDGKATYLTEGQLRLVNRPLPHKIEPATGAPRRSYLATDARPLVPGKTERIAFALLPLAVRLRAGHRLQLSFAGADKDTFIRVPATGEASFTILHDPTTPSSLTLPIASGAGGLMDVVELMQQGAGS